MLHHSLTKDGKVVDWQAIRRYHTEVNKWSDIGYHFGVEEINDQCEILVGRPLIKRGAHCKGTMNRDAIGICFVGNYDILAPPLSTILFAIHRIIIPLCLIFKIKPDYIIGHNQINMWKTCPGEKFDLNAFRQLVETELP